MEESRIKSLKEYMKEYELSQEEILNPMPLLQYFKEKDPHKKILMDKDYLSALGKMVDNLKRISKGKELDLEQKVIDYDKGMKESCTNTLKKLVISSSI